MSDGSTPTDLPEHDEAEAAEAAASPVDDRRRPRLLAGLAAEPMSLELSFIHI